MKALLRYMTIAAMGIAACTFVLLNPAMSQKDDVSPADELDYPILLVHGLGEGPGEDAFGKLEELLEKYYFDVEVMDFNEYSKNKLAKDKDAATLGVQAAILGLEIREIIDEYNQQKNTSVDRVHILAHSYGGLVAQAYLLNMGEEYNKKSGGYDNNVAKVLYVQVPFYGVKQDAEILDDLIDDTDYGPFLDKKVWKKTLEMGSEDLYTMHELLNADNIYRPTTSEPYPDAVTFVAADDEILETEFGMLNAFMKKGDTHQFHQYSVFDGKYGHYSHSTHPASAVDDMTSICYGVNIDDDNVLSIASFFDNGRNWRKIGLKPTIETGMLMIKYEKKPGFKNISESDVTVTLKKKYVESSVSGANKKNEKVNGYLNTTSRVFVFNGLAPGTYDLTIKNSKKGNLEEEFTLDPGDLGNYNYDPKKNELTGGSGVSGQGIFYKDQIIFTVGSRQEQEWHTINGLDTTGFCIEFDVVNIDMETYNKSTLFSLYNANGRSDDWRWNGSRLEFIPRGYRYLAAPGCITWHIMIDKDKDGAYRREEEGRETIEGKSHRKWNWFEKHHVKIRVMNTETGGSRYDCWVDEELVHPWRTGDSGNTDLTKSAPYYNPAPIVSFGCRFHDDKYETPTGAVITEFVIYNLDE